MEHTKDFWGLTGNRSVNQRATIFPVSQPSSQLKGLMPGLRNVVVAVEARVQKEVETKNAELAAKVHAATLEQIRHQVNKDLDVLRARLQGKEQEALESMKDQAYLRERQQNLRFNIYYNFTHKP